MATTKVKCSECYGCGRLKNPRDILGTETCPSCGGTGREGANPREVDALLVNCCVSNSNGWQRSRHYSPAAVAEARRRRWVTMPRRKQCPWRPDNLADADVLITAAGRRRRYRKGQPRQPYNATPCACRGKLCADWHVQPVAEVQGVHFTREQAIAVADLLSFREREAAVADRLSNPRAPLMGRHQR